MVLGTNDPLYLTLHDEADVLEKARAEEHLTILAHPFRWGDAGGLLKMGLLPDALEYRTPNHCGGPAREAEVAAEELGLPLVNAGDVHALSFIDRFWIETSAPLERPDDIRQIILDGAYENRTRDEK